MDALELRGVSKTYRSTEPLEVLKGVDFTLQCGERVAIVGKSGSGKSTLLNVVGLLDTISSGEYRLAGKDAAKCSDAERDWLRALHLGFVFQDAHVLGHRTVEENIALGLAAARRPRNVRASLVSDVLKKVNLDHRAHALGRLLSGGERQRLAIARAIAKAPDIILADEPTGNLDDENTEIVLSLLDQQAQDGVSILLITHDARVGKWADRVETLVNGRIESVL